MEMGVGVWEKNKSGQYSGEGRWLGSREKEITVGEAGGRNGLRKEWLFMIPRLQRAGGLKPDPFGFLRKALFLRVMVERSQWSWEGGRWDMCGVSWCGFVREQRGPGTRKLHCSPKHRDPQLVAGISPACQGIDVGGKHFQNGFDDPNCRLCQDLPGSHQANTKITDSKLASRNPGGSLASVSLTKPTSSHYGGEALY